MSAKNRSISRYSFPFGLGLGILLATLLVETASAQSKVVVDSLVSEALDGKAMTISVYLPPSYDTGDTRYPVLYYLHGGGGDHGQWVGAGIQTAMDSMIEEGEVIEMIIVMPSAPKSWYANSSVKGNYEDCIVEDLVEFIDGKYLTLAQRESRAIGGRSMGGNGALDLAFRHPDVYSAVVSHGGITSWNFLRDSGGCYPEGKYEGNRLSTNIALAYSPNPASPLKYDWPWDARGNVIPDVWQRWLEHDPMTMIETHQENVRQLQIYFDHGVADDVLTVEMARDFDRALTEAGIPHVYDEHDGGHGSAFASRPYAALPVLSNMLSSEVTSVAQEQPTEPESATSVRAKGKMITTWAKIKENETAR